MLATQAPQISLHSACTSCHFLAAGEVTLTGKVLPIGGVKEKTLAARRSGVQHIIFPEGNRRDWDELTEVSRCVVACRLRCLPFLN